jgi:hypothetical protein
MKSFMLPCSCRLSGLYLVCGGAGIIPGRGGALSSGNLLTVA